MTPLMIDLTEGLPLKTLQILCTPTARIIPGAKIPTNERNAPRKDEAAGLAYEVEDNARAPRKTAKLKFGPGNA